MTVQCGEEIKVSVSFLFEMWRQWDPLEKSTWVLPSGFSHVDNQVSQILCRQAGKISVSSHSPLLALIFSTCTMLYRYSFQTALFSHQPDTNLKTYGSKGVYPSWFIYLLSLRFFPLLFSGSACCTDSTCWGEWGAWGSYAFRLLIWIGSSIFRSEWHGL